MGCKCCNDDIWGRPWPLRQFGGRSGLRGCYYSDLLTCRNTEQQAERGGVLQIKPSWRLNSRAWSNRELLMVEREERGQELHPGETRGGPSKAAKKFNANFRRGATSQMILRSWAKQFANSLLGHVWEPRMQVGNQTGLGQRKQRNSNFLVQPCIIFRLVFV